mmetsp:Transcript_23028/g.43814  ORF Transcript_23028/g.43814 Transcript_23028/m.43814 type:complete len:251 (-) Transcript_23028:1209-1961(-)
MYSKKTIAALLTVLLPLVTRFDNVAAFVYRHGRMGRFPNAILTVRQFSDELIVGNSVQCYAQSSPTVEELASDDFMKQVFHSEKIVTMLQSDPENVLELLKAQLGHSDGIRGFFVTYLTMAGHNTPADQPDAPAALLTAMIESPNSDEIISLACMNVIMPTGMITMHKDETLSRQSQITAKRGVRVLRAIREKAGVKEECEAILAVASNRKNTTTNASKIVYWQDFFAKWGYGDIQKRDIAQAVQSVLSD